MEVPIAEFQRDLFDLASRALDGETISVTYNGERLRFIPEAQLAYSGGPDLDLREAKAELYAEFEELWEKKWADL